MSLCSRFHTGAIAALTAIGLLGLPAAARADFGFAPGSVGVVAENQNGTIDTQAGSHPYAFTVRMAFNRNEAGEVEGGHPRDLIVDLPPGVVGNPQAVPRCPRSAFEGGQPNCPSDTQIGVLHVLVGGVGEAVGPVYNMVPPPGVAAQIGFSAASDNAFENASVLTEEGYGIAVGTFDLPLEVESISETIWGTPADSAHDGERGKALNGVTGPVASSALRQPFLTLPTSCAAPLAITVHADSTLAPGAFVNESAVLADGAGNPASPTGCTRVPFDPEVAVQPSSRSAESATGLTFDLALPGQGLLEPSAIDESEPRKAVVTLPAGMTANPSMAVGIGVCTPAEYAAEQAGTQPGAGCPEASKIAEVIAHSPLIEEPIEGAIYLAAPYDNPFKTLLAGYLVARARDRGVIVKQAGRIELNPSTGQITASFEGLPPLPYSSFEVRFREGTRAPLVNPPVCGSYESEVSLTPFSVESDAEAATRTSGFQVNSGIDDGPCPPAGVPPFAPSLTAGTINNAAGHYSPLYLRIERKDGEQEITGFGTQLPPGLTGNLSGILFCTEADVRRAREQSGAEAEASPVCPAASEIGHTIAEAGVGSVLAQTPGRLYLGGPFEGAPFSVVSVTSAKVGPFDLGTVVVHLPLAIDPVTAQVSIPSDAQEQIPHIIDGVVIHLRTIRIYIDREHFTINPTSCAPMTLAARVIGSGANFASAADDVPASSGDRFQAANCANLAFKPSFRVSTSAKATRKDGASLSVSLTYPKEALGKDANIHAVRVELPKALPSRLSTLQKACIEAQFDANPAGCPAESVVGYAKAITPILPVPLEGPAYFVSRGAEWPELIMVLQGYGLTIELHGETHISKGVTSSTFPAVPDQPVESFRLTLPAGPHSALAAPGGKLCQKKLIMPTRMTGQNGKAFQQKTRIQVQGCPDKLFLGAVKVKGRRLKLRVGVPAAGRLTATGHGLGKASKKASGRETLTLTLKRHSRRSHPARIRLSFTPSNGSGRKKLTRSITVKPA